MDIYQALEKDHKTVEGLLNQLCRSSKADDGKAERILDQIRCELIPHARAEEAVFYNVLREDKKANSLIFHAYSEHAKAEAIIMSLNAAHFVNANWASMADKLREEIQHHVEEEEGKIFTAAQEILTDEEALQMGSAFLNLKAMLAKDGDSLMGSQLDLMVNLVPKKWRDSFRRGFKKGASSAA